jgi:hypothetical protein
MSLREAIRDEIALRHRRAAHIPAHLLGEPGWDMLIDLALARIEGRRVYITSACIASGVPPTTGLRWTNVLIEAGMAKRTADRHDLRRFWLDITDAGFAAVEASFFARGVRAA